MPQPDLFGHWRLALEATVILCLAQASAVAVAGRRRRALAPSQRELAGFVAVGVAIAAMIEWLATRGRWARAWACSSAMPLIPGIGIGLSPLLQWVAVPPIVLGLARRQSAHAGVVNDRA